MTANQFEQVTAYLKSIEGNNIPAEVVAASINAIIAFTN